MMNDHCAVRKRARLLRAALGFAIGLILIAIAWLPAHAFADAAWYVIIDKAPRDYSGELGPDRPDFAWATGGGERHRWSTLDECHQAVEAVQRHGGRAHCHFIGRWSLFAYRRTTGTRTGNGAFLTDLTYATEQACLRAAQSSTTLGAYCIDMRKEEGAP